MLWNYLVILTWKWRTILKMNDQRKADLIKLIMGFFFFLLILVGKFSCGFMKSWCNSDLLAYFHFYDHWLKWRKKKKSVSDDESCNHIRDSAKLKAWRYTDLHQLLFSYHCKCGINQELTVKAWYGWSASVAHLYMCRWEKKKRKKRKTVQRLRGARKRWAVG